MTFAIFSSYRPTPTKKQNEKTYILQAASMAGHKNSFPPAPTFGTTFSTPGGTITAGATSFPLFPVKFSSYPSALAHIAASSLPWRATSGGTSGWFSGCEAFSSAAALARASTAVSTAVSASSCALRDALRDLCSRRRFVLRFLRPGDVRDGEP